MRRLIFFSFVALGLILTGCADQSSLVGPTQQISQQQGRTLIDLPISSLDKSIKASGKIDGAEGGTIEFEGELKGGVEFEGKLEIPEGAFEGTLNFTIELDKKYAGFNFGPKGATFDKPLLFTAEIEGLNLDGVDPDNVQFVFVDKDGNFVPVVYEKMEVDVEDGELKVENAQLWHFSRYGWAK